MLSGLSILGRLSHAPLGLGGLLGTSQVQCVRSIFLKRRKKERPPKPPIINGTYVLERKNELRLHKTGSQPRRLRGPDFVYRVGEVRQLTTPVKVILRDVVLDVGVRGQVVEVPPLYGHEDLLLTGKAVYATKENLEKFAEDIESSFSSVSAYFTKKRLSELLLMVDMNAENPWKVEKWHVRSAFRRAGVWLTDDCITLPETPIEGPNPNSDNQDFVISVTINKREETPVQARIRLCGSSARRTRM